MRPILMWLERFFWVAVAGAVLLIVGLWVEDPLQTKLIVIGVIAMVPLFIYLYIVPIWHWKSRYRGEHSLLWGAALLLETSGWLKIVYWFRHVLPDVQQRGRYLRRSGDYLA